MNTNSFRAILVFNGEVDIDSLLRVGVRVDPDAAANHALGILMDCLTFCNLHYSEYRFEFYVVDYEEEHSARAEIKTIKNSNIGLLHAYHTDITLLANEGDALLQLSGAMGNAYEIADATGSVIRRISEITISPQLKDDIHYSFDQISALIEMHESQIADSLSAKLKSLEIA